MPTEFEEGFLVGLLVGEGHFGGDGRQPQVTLRMHERHAALFRWLQRTFGGGRLYGPYDHGGRRYYQWMARGAYLRDELLPLIEHRLTPELDEYAHRRVAEMLERYPRKLRRAGEAPDEDLQSRHGDPPTSAYADTAPDAVDRLFDGLRAGRRAVPGDGQGERSRSPHEP